MCNKFHKYFVVKLEGGFQIRTTVRYFGESADDDVKKTSSVLFNFFC